MRITVSRRRWLRGGDGELLNKSGKMCCLGFGVRQCGVKAKDIRGLSMPSRIARPARTKALLDSPLMVVDELYWASNSKLSDDAASINDNDKIVDKEREKQLRSLFRAHGHQIVFVP
jgi:hypothetical protein